MTSSAIVLTAEQTAVADSSAPRTRISGEAGTGKTTALVARYLRLAALHPSSGLLVLGRNRAATRRFLDELVPSLRGGFDSLAVTTFTGVARDLLERHGRPRQLIFGPSLGGFVARLLDAERPEAWPRFGAFLARPGFAAALSRELVATRAAGRVDPDWPPELSSFADRYQAALDDASLADESGLLTGAAASLAAAPGLSPFTHVLVDDYEAATPATDALLRALLAVRGTGLTLAANPAVGFGPGRANDPNLATRLDFDTHLTLSHPFRQRSQPDTLVVCAHPANEAEAVAAEIAAAHDGGVAWGDLAVLVRHPARRATAIGRAFARHGIPAHLPPATVAENPLAAAVIDMLRWAAGDGEAPGRLLASPLCGLPPATVRAVRRQSISTGSAVADHPVLADLVALRDHIRFRAAQGDGAGDLAYEVWARAIAPRVAASRSAGLSSTAIDALVTLVDDLAAADTRSHGDRLGPAVSALDSLAAIEDADGRLSRPSSATATADAVTVCSVGSAAGREWQTVVLAGCVEGDLPSATGRANPFRPTTPADRRRQLDDEARIFQLAISRATAAVVAVAAPHPGVLVSRYVTAWPRRPAAPLAAPGAAPIVRPPTAGPVPMASDGRLHLSATQLDTYADCGLRYFFSYVLRARGDAGVHADLGSLIHAVLAEFTDPAAGPRPPTRDGLMELARARWRDDIARYRPQVEEARRDYYDMLERWWSAEGDPASEAHPDVAGVEHRFKVEVDGHVLSGSIDRVDRVTEGDGSPAIRIVDYKTGRVPRGSVDDNLQLALYHLASTRDPSLAALGPARTLRLQYLRSGRNDDRVIDDAEAAMAVTEARVIEAADRILAEDFEPSVEANCRYCDFQRLCPIQVEGRQVGDT